MHVILNLCVCTNRISQVSWQVLWFQLSCRFLHWRGCLSSLLLHSLQNISKAYYLDIPPESSIADLQGNQHFFPPLPPSKSALYPVTLFIALILLRYIILKLIPTYIYLIKSHSLDLAVKKFHKHTRSSFREIVLFAWKFKENL